MPRIRSGAVVSVLALALVAALAGPARAEDAPPPVPAPAALAPPVQKAVETTKKAIAACLMKDEAQAFPAYLALIHPERKPTERAVSDIQRYSWSRFRKQCRHFIQGDDVETLSVLRVQPEDVPPDAETFKVFFQPVSQPDRLPAPIIFRKQGEDWLIDTNSM
jgi:hypothetical protein